MKPGDNSKHLLGITRSKGKMFEYSVPAEHHIAITRSPARLFSLAVGLLGDLAASINEFGPDHEKAQKLTEDLTFSAHFFDAFLQSKLEPGVDHYVGLLSAASYYLCNFPGSAHVMASRVGADLDLKVQRLDRFLFSILTSNFGGSYLGEYSSIITKLSNSIEVFFRTGNLSEEFDADVHRLRKATYQTGTPRELLIADVACALLRTKIRNSTWRIIPEATSVSIEEWRPILAKPSFVRELWPAQRLLAESGVFDGKSAVIQMPTSAGKTRSIEIIIRAAFLKRQTKLAVLVMPFRALCHEVRDALKKAFTGEAVNVDELTEVFQNDFEAGEVLQSSENQILVVTPEKLVYVLRQTPELAQQIGLLIFDEGHQFDSGLRGVTYELLISALKPLIPESSQKILISAVISNSEAINSWLNGEAGLVVKGDNLSPTFRTVGFSSWSTAQGQIQYVEQPNIDNGEFFVPRVIEAHKLSRRPRERKDRFFPNKENGSSVSLYLGLRLVKNGSVAVFCGLKSTVIKLCEILVEAHARDLPMPTAATFSDADELEKIGALYARNLGDLSLEVECAKIGILTHHGAVPHGLRLCVEHAMREGFAKFVLCTSTLAQGVNLPIRYLIFTSIYQAGEMIKVRDFHNLIGRAGRSGMHTEGSIIFGDPEVYDGKRKRNERWRWAAVKRLIEPKNSEPCASSLLSIFDPVFNAKEDLVLKDFSIVDVLEAHLNDPDSLSKLIKEISEAHETSGFDALTIQRQFEYKVRILSTIESYLLSSACDVVPDAMSACVETLAKETLAYHLASEEVRTQLVKVFTITAMAIEKSGFSPEKRRTFGKTLLGLRAIQDIETWISENTSQIILSSENEGQLLNCLWPIVEKYIGKPDFKKCSPSKSRFLLVSGWMSGNSFETILKDLLAESTFIKAGQQKRELKIQHVVEMCEGGLAYDGMLLLGAIAEILETWPTSDESDVDWGGGSISFSDTTIPDTIRSLQKKIKYGLNSKAAIEFYELGFSDRVLAQDFAGDYGLDFDPGAVPEYVVSAAESIRSKLAGYPSYFLSVLESLI
jgi:POLQ-like helicase